MRHYTARQFAGNCNMGSTYWVDATVQLKMEVFFLTFVPDFTPFCAMLNEEEQNTLLVAARASILAGVAGVSGSTPAGLTSELKSLKRTMGAFVSLYLAGELRGCVGYVESSLPLFTTVVEVARKSALEDPRFTPVTLKDLKEITIEISALSVPSRVSSIEEIILGTHGVVFEMGHRKSVFLPQVAPDFGWDRETLLSQLARKAGLRPSDWKHPLAVLKSFTAEIFSEHPPRILPL